MTKQKQYRNLSDTARLFSLAAVQSITIVFGKLLYGYPTNALSLFDFKPENFLQKEININQHNGIYGAIIGNIKETDIQYPLNCYFSLLFDEVSQQVIIISLVELHDADSTYFNDYSKIVQSLRFASDEAETSASVETETTTETTAEVRETPQVIRIGIDDLETERNENAAAAKSKYKGQCIEVVGRVGSIDSDLDFISILSPTDSWDIVGVHCSLVNDDVKEKVKTLKVDQTVIVRGTITDVGEILGYFMDAEDIITE